MPANLFSWQPTALQAHLLELGVGSAAAPSTMVGNAAQFRRLADTLELRGGNVVLHEGHEIDWGAVRLLPLVAWKARDALGHEWSNAGIAALWALLGQSMIERRTQDGFTAKLVAQLEDAGIESLVLKGAALGHLAYPDPGTRPMSDIDLLVRPEDVERVQTWVGTAGGKIAFPNLRPTALRTFRHSAPVTLPDGEFDLHWRILFDRFEVEADRKLWLDPIELHLAGATIRTPRPEHHLIHAIVHGMEPNTLASVRWIADATLLTRCDGFDWDRVVSSARDRRIGSLVAHGLGIIAGFAPDSIPQEVVAVLSRSGPGRMDLYCRRPNRTRAEGAVKTAVFRYVVGSTNWPTHRRLTQWPSYLRFVVDSGMISRPVDIIRGRTRSA